MSLAIIILLALAAAADCPPQQLNYQKLGQAAQQAFQRGDYAEAARNFRLALCIAPNNADVYHGLGLAEAAAGHFDLADKALAQADRLSPQKFAILLPRAQVQASAGNFEQSSRTLGEAERLAPAGSEATIVQLHGQLGGALLQKGQLDLALAQLLRATRGGLRDPSILLMLATLENNLGAYDDAIRDALSVNGAPAQQATAVAVAGLAYKNQKKAEDAIRTLKRAIELGPGEPAYLALAEIYQQSEQPAEAAKLLTQAADALPGSGAIAVSLGRSLIDAGDYQRAEAVLAAVTQKNPADVEARRWLAQAQSSAGKYKEATATLEQVAKWQPAYPMIDIMMAQSLLKWESPDYERALRYLDRAGQAAPTDPDVPYLRGKIYFSLGRYAEAIKPLQRAIELGPGVATPYYQLGQALQRLGRDAEAREQFDKFKYLK